MLALAPLARYPGVTFAATGLVGLVVFRQCRARRRTTLDVLLFAAITCLPIIVWFARDIQQVGTLAGRQLVFHPVTLGVLEQGPCDSLGMGIAVLPFVLYRSPAVIGLALVVLALVTLARLVFLIYGFSRSTTTLTLTTGHPIEFLLTVFVVICTIFLLVAISWADWGEPLDSRLLIPINVV